MRAPNFLAIAASTLLFCVFHAQAQVPRIAEMKPGRYSYNIVTEMPGLPIKPPPVNFEQCVTAKDVDEGKALQAQRDAGMTCKYSDMKSRAGSYSYKASCNTKDGMNMDMTADITASGDTSLMNNVVKMSGKNIPPNMGTSKSKMTMRRLGDCPK